MSSNPRPKSAAPDKTSALPRPKSAAAAEKPRKLRDRGNLSKFLCDEKPISQQSITDTPKGINSNIISVAAKKKEILIDLNEIPSHTETPVFITEGLTLSKTAPVTKKFTTYFKGISAESGLGDVNIKSANMNKKVIKQQCNEDFSDYWLSLKSVVPPHERIKVLTVKPEKVSAETKEFSTDVDDDEQENIEQPVVETRFERIRRLKKLQDLLPIDPIAIQLRAEELKLVADCKAQYRHSYNDTKRSLERGGAFEPIMVSDSSTVDVDALIGDLTLQEPKTPGDELIIAAAEGNTGPFFIMEFMKPLIQSELGLEGGSFADVEEIDLTSKMLGDEKVLCVAKALKHTPNVKRLSIAGNGLTDRSITAILSECFGALGCSFIDISDNKVDSESIVALKVYLMTMTCKLEELALSSSDIDDTECAAFMSALMVNKSLTYLDMSHNAIGTKEVPFVLLVVTVVLPIVCFVVIFSISLQCVLPLTGI